MDRSGNWAFPYQMSGHFFLLMVFAQRIYSKNHGRRHQVLAVAILVNEKREIGVDYFVAEPDVRQEVLELCDRDGRPRTPYFCVRVLHQGIGECFDNGGYRIRRSQKPLISCLFVGLSLLVSLLVRFIPGGFDWPT